MAWKYFNDQEAVGLSSDLMFKLDRARELFGYPIVITCGYRSPEHNAEVGGVEDSAHTKGMAVDIRKPPSEEGAARLVWALCVAGFKRIEFASHHLHADVDNSKQTPAFWVGISN